MRFIPPSIILLLFMMFSCSGGRDYFGASYPSKLKSHGINGNKSLAKTPVKTTSAFQENTSNENLNDNSEVVNTADTVLVHLNGVRSDQIFISDAPLENSLESDVKSDNQTIEASNTNQFSHTNESDCPTIIDLSCEYFGEGIYKLTWSEPKIPIYNENGTISEYRITRRTPEDNKAFLYKTPEPDCVDGTCTIIFKNLNNRTGYLWTVEARCSRSTFTSSNRVKCGPIINPVSDNTDHTNLENTQQNTGDDANEISTQNSKTTFDKNRRKTANRNSVKSIILIPFLMLAGIAALFLLLVGEYAAGGILLFFIISGCIWAIYLAIKGIIQINSQQFNENGRILSYLSILASLIGLFISSALFIFEVF